MKKVVGIVALTLVGLMIIILLFGCGVSQEEYNRVSAQLRASQAQVTELQMEYSNVNADLRDSQSQVVELQREYSSVNGDLRDSQSQVVELQREIRGLKEQYEIVGETPTETAENIVKWYHETHIYSKYDFFVCSDMALDVWNMLKAQGIDALINIGNVEMGAENITEADHAWVLAETSPGKYLALETTGGYAVSDNPLYYKGWSFDNPAEYKRFVELKHEYDFRASLVKQLGESYEASRLASVEARDQLLSLAKEVEGMSVVDPRLSFKLAEVVEKAVELGKHIGRCDQLTELINEQNQQLTNILSEMKGLFQ